MRGRFSNGSIALMTCAFGGFMFVLPMILTRNTGPLQNKQGPLTGSQRQRGLYLNAGSQDVGPDPDWDPVTNTRRPKKKINVNNNSNNQS